MSETPKQRYKRWLNEGDRVLLKRMTISFSAEERAALNYLSEESCRPPKEQLRWILREEYKRCGLWPDEPATGEVEQ